MAEQKGEPCYCPNCQQPAIKDGKSIICVRCDATFSVTRTGAATVTDVGPLEEIKERLARLEEKAVELKGGGKPAEAGPGPDDLGGNNREVFER